jgi:hypothetical protein
MSARLAFSLAAPALLVPVVLFAAAGAKPGGDAQTRRLTLLYTAEIHGTPEPCGCTSDPLGDVARYGAVVQAARLDSGAVLLVDAGGISYPEGGAAPKERAANELRATFLGRELERLGLRAAGLAETDLGPDPSKLTPHRLAANFGRSPLLEPSALVEEGGIRVGVLGVADPALAGALGTTAQDPVIAARAEAERLRKAGAEVVVALAPVDKSAARRLAREAKVDIVVLGRQVGGGMARAEPVGAGFLVAPADELQKVGRIDLVLRGNPGSTGPLVDAGGAEANEARKAEIDRALGRLDEELRSWEAPGQPASPGTAADPTFVAAKKRERDTLRAERARLDAPWTPPATGSYFTNRLVPLRRSLPRNPATARAMRKLDGQIATINLRAAPPPPPREPGRAYFVGRAQCTSCHKTQAAFWDKTVHAHAWQTLVDGGKQADYKCVGCHVTGYGQVGGSSLGHTAKLEDVQCETCHGPGSIHVAEKGLEEPAAVHRATPESTCVTCHNEHHSDTFKYEAYLRDILGPGHGASARQKLGDGPTGHALRSAALAKAKAAGQADLRKL